MPLQALKFEGCLAAGIQYCCPSASGPFPTSTRKSDSLSPSSRSFLFWQQYFDSDDGSKYCRHYLAKWPTYPHIGLIDPVTGQLVKCWSGFVSAERLIDKLMDFADKPPKDVVFSSDVPMTEAGGGQPVSEDAQLAQALAMSKEGRSAPMANEPTNASVHRPKEPWPSAPECPESGAPGSVVLRVRLPNGQNFMQAFSLEHTLRDVCCIVHHKAGVPLSTTKVSSVSCESRGPPCRQNSRGTPTIGPSWPRLRCHA
mgnify:CR=1 FL=1